MTTRYEEYHARWIILRSELWAAEKRIAEIKKELHLVEAWLTAMLCSSSTENRKLIEGGENNDQG